MVLVIGGVKNAGGLPANFSVVPDPPALFLTAFFLWLFFWKSGGRMSPTTGATSTKTGVFRRKRCPLNSGRRGPRRSLWFPWQLPF